MNNDIIAAHWQQLQGAILKNWGKLTEDDLAEIEGSLNELVGLIREKYGIKKAQAIKEINEFLESGVLDTLPIKVEKFICESISNIKEKSNDTYDDIANHITKNPVKSICLAIAAGAVSLLALKKIL